MATRGKKATRRKKPKAEVKGVDTSVVEQKQADIVQMSCPIVYADYTNLTLSYTGFRFLFSVAVEKTEERAILSPQAAVCMSAEHALQVYRLMESQLELYQKQYGQIRELPEKRQE